MMRFLTIVTILLLTCCTKEKEAPESRLIAFGKPIKVSILDYNDHTMEPFLSRDGNFLFFNNLNSLPANTNLHYASKINDSVFQYIGELDGVNTDYLEGVPSMDESNDLYFVSTRSYDQTLSTIYKGDFTNGDVINIEIVQGISKNQAGWVNFDVEASKDGNYLYIVDGRFDENGGPYEADIILALKNGDLFHRSSENTLENVNTNALEYAACISSNMLELYFTRVELPLSASSMPQIYIATRSSLNDPFSKPYKINEVTGFVEAPTISTDDRVVYFHKYEEEKYVIYMIKKELNK